ncbi:MAG: FtsX-like permease family protein [Chitinophagales bacterium]
MAISFKPIRPLLQTGTSPWSRWFSYIGLALGVLLLLCCVQMYVNMQKLTKEANIRKNGYDYVAVTKNVSGETTSRPEQNMFSQQDIDEIKGQSFIEDVAPVIANQFRVQLSAGELLPFQTEFFIESLKNDFLDTIPPSFSWQEGQEILPIIFSTDFFEIYNVVFAPGQSLPQFSRKNAAGIRFLVTCFGNGQQQNFVAQIVAFSDRVNSVLVPESFLTWANTTFGSQKPFAVSRIFIKTKDANNPDLIRYLDTKGYSINKEKTILGRNKMLIQNVLSGLGIFGLVVVILALMLFSFYLQLIIARSKDNLSLLLTLGYSPRWLSKNVSNRFLPVYISIVVIALGLTQLAQWAFHHFVMHDKPELSPFIHWSILVAALLLIILSLVTNYRLVRKQLYKLN